MTFKYKTKPYQHQKEALEKSYEEKNFAYFMEMGCGKSKVLIDNIAWLYENKREAHTVDCKLLLVVDVRFLTNCYFVFWILF